MKVDSTSNSSLQSLKDGLQRTQQGETAAPSAQGAASPAPSTGGGASGDANVSLSALSAQLRGLAASGAADIDTAHVESIKQALRDGTLSIDTGKIADAVLETARSLLQTRAGSAGN